MSITIDYEMQGQIRSDDPDGQDALGGAAQISIVA
jgi:hypothetical protein